MNAKRPRPSPSDSSSSSSDDDDSSSTTTTSSSTDSYSTSSSSESSSTSTPPAKQQNRPGDGKEKSKVNHNSASNSNNANNQWRMQRNATLTFERQDMEFIVLPRVQTTAHIGAILHRLTVDRTLYPEGRYRTLDYFRTAVEMFVDVVRAEHSRQQQVATKNGKTMSRFTWKNDGELAVCFACCCDWLKLLYGKLAPSPFKPHAEDFVGQMKTMLMAVSRVPKEILPRKTYDTKYLDWEKGGTRYHSAQSSANVRFPSAQDRRNKIEAYLRANAGYKAATVRVESIIAAARATAAAPPTGVRVKSTAAASAAGAVGPGRLGGAVPPFVPPYRSLNGPGPVRNPAGAARGLASAAAGRAPHPPAQVAVKQVPDALRHLYWLSSLAHVKGGEPGAALPDERIAALPGLVRLCNVTQRPSEAQVLVDVVTSSSERVQRTFERIGGVVGLRRLLGRVVRHGGADSHRCVEHFVERLVRYRWQDWGAASQRAWRTDLEGETLEDLQWLREYPHVNEDYLAQWAVLVTLMEERFIHRLPRPELVKARKRRRLESFTYCRKGGGGVSTPLIDGMRDAVADNLTIQQWRSLRPYTLRSVRLPTDLCAPPYASEVEKDKAKFINRRREFAEATQKEWVTRLRGLMRISAPGVAEIMPIPLFYDPYFVLNVEPYD